MSKNTRNRILLTAVAALLLVTLTIGGTIAWLTDTSSEVKNTFTTSTIDIELTETENLDLQMIPGGDITKDPKVTVTTPDVDAYVFVKITESENFRRFMSYEIAEGWTLLDGTTYVYYREVEENDSAYEYAVLKDNKVTVLDNVTKEDMSENFTAPTLTFNAYVIQKTAAADATAAWKVLFPSSTAD